ncbi:MAG: hypothetical protein K2K59_03235, partial [Muribaculaceae bacterium]|nr:hypothetical protein [Muribaculaceae bacterium]
MQWRLFLPLTLLIWLIMGLLVVYMVRHEKQVKRENLELQLRNVNTTIIKAYEEGRDLQQVVEFIDDYNDNTTLDALRISVYDSDNKLIASAGVPLVIENPQHNLIDK